MAEQRNVIELFVEIYEKKCVDLGVRGHPVVLNECKRAVEQGIPMALLKLNGSASKMKNCRLEDADIFSLAEALADCSAFSSVDLSFNQISNSGAKSLAHYMTRCDLLQSLNLQSNDISELGSGFIIDSLEKSSLSTLNLYGVVLGDQIGSKLAKALEKNDTLTDLNIGNCELRLQAVMELCLAIGSSSSNNDEFSNPCVLQRLILDDVRLTPYETDAARHLGNMLGCNKSLESLSLAKQKMSDEGCGFICDGLLCNSTLTEINLKCNYIGSKGCEAFGFLLSDPVCVLERLNLSGNRLTDYGAEAIAQGLAENRSLLSLNMSFCSICDSGLAILGSSLTTSDVVGIGSEASFGSTRSDCSEIQALYLTGNSFGEKSTMVFRYILGLNEISQEVHTKPLTKLNIIDFLALIQLSNTP